jgi:hypothetical protein
MKLDRRHHQNVAYFCQDCLFLFSVHSKLNNKIPYCPKCGDNLAVKHYEQKIVKDIKLWTDEELHLIGRLIKGEIKNYQVAALTGRTIDSVMSKMYKVKNGYKKRRRSE